MDRQLSSGAATLMSLATAGTLLLVWGGWQLFKRGDRQKGILMWVCAAVVAGNIAIWVV